MAAIAGCGWMSGVGPGSTGAAFLAGGALRGADAGRVSAWSGKLTTAAAAFGAGILVLPGDFAAAPSSDASMA
jgi:hypothetical protein